MKLQDYVLSKLRHKVPQAKPKKKPKKRGSVLTLSEYTQKRTKSMVAQEYIEKYLAMLPTGNGVSQNEAERRAAEFLRAMAELSTLRHFYSTELSKGLSLERAMYGKCLSEVKGDKITENKLKVEANHGYQEFREKLEGIQSDLDYLKHHYDIFTNAHILYRQLSKVEFSG